MRLPLLLLLQCALKLSEFPLAAEKHLNRFVNTRFPAPLVHVRTKELGASQSFPKGQAYARQVVSISAHDPDHTVLKRVLEVLSRHNRPFFDSKHNYGRRRVASSSTENPSGAPRSVQIWIAIRIAFSSAAEAEAARKLILQEIPASEVRRTVVVCKVKDAVNLVVNNLGACSPRAAHSLASVSLLLLLRVCFMFFSLIPRNIPDLCLN